MAIGHRLYLSAVLGSLRAVRDLRGALAILAGMSFISQVGIAMMLPLIPLYALELGASRAQLGYLTSAFSAANLVSQLGSGFLIDRIGSRPLIRAGIGAYAGANVLIATASNAVSVIAYRGVAGLGGGANLVADRVYLSQTAAPERLAFTNGVLSAAASSGQLIGPAIGGVLGQFYGLSAPFVVVAITSGLAFIGSLFLPVPPRRPAPTVAPGAFLNRAIVVILVANLLLLTTYGGFITTFAAYATTQLGWQTFEVGFVFSFFALGSILLGPWLAGLADRTGRRRMAIIGAALIALFGVSFAAELPRPLLYAVAALSGAGIAVFTASTFALLTAASPEARRGRTFGFVNAFASLGVIVGAIGGTAIWDLLGLRMAILAVSGGAALAGVALLAFPREPVPYRSPIGEVPNGTA